MTGHKRKIKDEHPSIRRAKLSPEARPFGIGSLGFTDPAEAVNFVNKYYSEFPFWPQLPKRSMNETLIYQFSLSVPFLVPNHHKSQFQLHRSRVLEYNMERFKEAVETLNWNFFSFRRDAAAGWYQTIEHYESMAPDDRPKFFKGQIIGPFTLGKYTYDNEGRSLIDYENHFNNIQMFLGLHAYWQMREIMSLGMTPIITIDEPALGLRSVKTSEVPFERAIASIKKLINVISKNGGYAGIHICSDADWEAVLKTNVNIIAPDVYTYTDNIIEHAPVIARWLKHKNNAIVLGIVPTREFINETTKILIKEKLNAVIEAFKKEGLSENEFISKSFVSSSCGLGTHSAEMNELISSEIRYISDYLRAQINQ